MAYKIYQKLQSGMANQGLLDAADVDVMEDGQRVTLAEKLSGLSKDVAGMAEDVSDAVAVADGIKTAQGQEVGDVAETDIAEGVLIWHGGKLYRVLSLIAAGDHWQDMDVAETTVSEEINAMRGVSTEGVYLTITPASAIPAGGVKARIYNASTDTYLPEVTFTPASPSHLLGQIDYGDVYTIIMPSIDGYTQPADQTFKAGQMLRQRTVEYIDSVQTSEALVIRAATSNGSSIGAYNAVVRLYNGQGAITQTINVSIEGGVSQVVNIPFGTKYSVTYPVISGYYTPKNQTEIMTASTANRYLNANYVFIPAGAYQWVIYDGTNIEYLPMDTDLTSYVANNTLFGAAFLDSSLVRSEVDGGDCRFIMSLDMAALGNKKWSSPAVDVPSVQNTGGRNSTAPNMFNGAANSRAVLDAILQYEIDNNVTVESVFKDLDQGITLGGDTVKMFIPAWRQFYVASMSLGTLNNALNRFGSSKVFPSLRYNGFTSLQSSASEAYKYVDGYDGSVNKTATTGSVFAFLPIISVTQSNN